MTSSILHKPQTPEQLADVHGSRDYYWYLRSPEFQRAFLEPLGKVINRLGSSCLDVGCGQGYLSRFVNVPYIGFDGSSTAIEHAREHNPGIFLVHRIEAVQSLAAVVLDPFYEFDVGTIVFGNLWGYQLVRRACQVPLMVQYQQEFNARYLIVWDLETLDTTLIDSRFALVEEYHTSVEIENLQEVKKRRKIMVYQCR